MKIEAIMFLIVFFLFEFLCILYWAVEPESDALFIGVATTLIIIAITLCTCLILERLNK